MPVFDPGVPWLRGTATLTNGSTTVETDGVITLNEILEGDRLYARANGGAVLGPFEIVGGEDDEIELREAFEGATGSYAIAIDRNPITRTGAKVLRDVAQALASMSDYEYNREDVEQARDEAQTARDQAVAAAEATEGLEDKADEAIAAAGSAVTAADQAESARSAAEAARDAAQLNARIYPTTAAGLAATTDGDYFSVPSPDDDEYLILYRNSGGSATEVRRYPSAEAVSAVSEDIAERLASVAPTSLDFNALDQTGLYRSSHSASGTIGSPSSNAYVGLLHIQKHDGSQRANQLAFQQSASDPRIWTRVRNADGSWNDWVELAQLRNTVPRASSLENDWDAITQTGFYRNNSWQSGVGLPIDALYLGLLHIEKDSGFAHQLALRQNSAEQQMWLRTRGGNNPEDPADWGSWVEVVTTARADDLISKPQRRLLRDHLVDNQFPDMHYDDLAAFEAEVGLSTVDVVSSTRPNRRLLVCDATEGEVNLLTPSWPVVAEESYRHEARIGKQGAAPTPITATLYVQYFSTHDLSNLISEEVVGTYEGNVYGDVSGEHTAPSDAVRARWRLHKAADGGTSLGLSTALVRKPAADPGPTPPPAPGDNGDRMAETAGSDAITRYDLPLRLTQTEAEQLSPAERAWRDWYYIDGDLVHRDDLPAYDPGVWSIDADFPTGDYREASVDTGPDRVTIRANTGLSGFNARHFAARLRGAAGRQPEVTVTHADEWNTPLTLTRYRLVWSHDLDSDDWRLFDNEVYDEQNNEWRFSNNEPFAYGTVYLTKMPHYSVGRYDRKIMEWMRNRHTRPTPSAIDGYRIGTSLARQVSFGDKQLPAMDHFAFRVGHGDVAVVVTAGVHPQEVPAHYQLEGVMGAILSETATGRALREQFTFYVYPRINAQGLWAGAQRFDPQSGRDANRIWGHQATTSDLRDIYEGAWAADIGGVAQVAIDLHSWPSRSPLAGPAPSIWTRSGADTPAQTAWLSTLESNYRPYSPMSFSSENAIEWFMREIASPKIAVLSEYSHDVRESVDDIRAWGRDLIRALYDVRAEFG